MRLHRANHRGDRTALGDAMTDDPDAPLRALWSEMGVPQERQDQLIAEITAKAQPGAMVGPFRTPYAIELTPIGEQFVLPGCEKNVATGKQLSLW